MWRIVVLLSIIFFSLSFGLYKTWEKREQEIFERHVQVQLTTYETTIHLYRTFAVTLYEEVINLPETLSIMAEAYTASPERQSALRGRLYRLLYPAYNRLTSRNLRQLHFHFPDNTTFIRFHRLEKYGDSLTDIRESVRLANEQCRPVFGFENGRIYCGFRYVFPLSYQGKHIGSVETSVSFDAIRKAMQDASPGNNYLFIQKKDIVLAKAFPSERQIYKPVAVAPGYVVEDLRILGLDVDDPISPLARMLDSKLGSSRRVQEHIQDKIPFSTLVQHQEKDYLVTFLPIRNIKGEQVAYIISYQQDEEIAILWNTFRSIIIGQILLLSALGFFIGKHQNAVERIGVNEARLRAITTYMGEALYVNDENGKIIFSNHAMGEQLGYSHAELIGRDAHRLFHRH